MCLCGLAGICAYLITLDEMLHRAAVIAGWFVVPSGGLAILLPRLIVNR